MVLDGESPGRHEGPLEADGLGLTGFDNAKIWFSRLDPQYSHNVHARVRVHTQIRLSRLDPWNDDTYICMCSLCIYWSGMCNLDRTYSAHVALDTGLQIWSVHLDRQQLSYVAARLHVLQCTKAMIPPQACSIPPPRRVFACCCSGRSSAMRRIRRRLHTKGATACTHTCLVVH